MFRKKGFFNFLQKSFYKGIKGILLTRKVAIIFILFMVFICNFTFAKEDAFGLGIILGEPTGISFKKWIENTTAIDGGIAWSFIEKSALHLHVDYLFHDFNLLKTEKGKLPFYYGIGCRIKAERKSKVGVRIPIGISYIFEKAPIDIFLELGPLLDLIPATDFGFTVNIGCRYYF